MTSLAAALTLSSCSMMKKAGSGSVSLVKSASSATAEGVAKLIPGERIKVVEVREQDLKDLPTGSERLAEYNRESEQKRGLLASFKLPLFTSGRSTGNVPVPKLPFKEGAAADSETQPDVSLLPPLPE